MEAISTIFTPARAGFCRTRSHTSKPNMVGSATSRSSRSGVILSTASSASLPSVQRNSSNGSVDSTFCTAWQNATLSLATTTLSGPCACGASRRSTLRTRRNTALQLEQRSFFGSSELPGSMTLNLFLQFGQTISMRSSFCLRKYSPVAGGGSRAEPSPGRSAERLC